MKYVIFDLDNCLADDAWRIPLIRWDLPPGNARYAAYHAAAVNDPPACNGDVFRLETAAGATPIFITARPNSVREATLDWLANNDLLTNRRTALLLMRNDTDARPSALVKQDALRALGDWNIPLADITCAYDDHPEILAMYDSHDINTVQLKIHDVCAYTPPRKRAPELLAAGAVTFRERNAVYGDNYLHYGDILKALYPQGLTLNSAAEFNRFAMIVNCLNKLSRYAQNAEGHQDSAHDLMVYAAMLEEVTP